MRNLSKIIILCLGILFSNIFSIKSYSQSSGKSLNVNAYGIDMSFSKTQSDIKNSDLASNVLRVVNNTNSDMTLNLQITPPQEWKLFGDIERIIEITAKDSIFIPVRVRPNSNIKGDANYSVNAFLSNEEFTITNDIWYISVKKVSNWQVYLSNNKIYLPNNADSTLLRLRLVNNGNSDEHLLIKSQADRNIRIINADKSESQEFKKSILLKVGQDTSINVIVKTLKGTDLPNITNIENGGQNKRYRIKFLVTPEKISKGSSKLWTGTTEIFELQNKTKVDNGSNGKIPLTIDLQNYDLLSQSTYASLNLFGSKRFKNKSFINYYFQSNFVQNQLDYRSFLGNYHYLGYFHRLFAIEVGNIGTVQRGSTLNGKGIKASVNIDKHTVGAAYVRQPYLFDRNYAQGYGAFHTFSNKFIKASTFFQHQNNDLQKIESDYASTDLNIRLSRKHMLKIGGGFSKENHYWNINSPFDVIGYGAKLGYAANLNKIRFNINSYYGSENYLPMRGVFSTSGIMNYIINKKYTLSAKANYFDFNPNIYNRGSLNDTIYNKRQTYGLKLIKKDQTNTYIFEPNYHQINSIYIKSNTKGVNFEYRKTAKNSFKFYAILFAGYTAFDNHPELNNIFVSHIRSSVRYKNIQANLRYYYGPYYSIDQSLYIENQENPQKWYTSIYYDYWFMKNKMRLNINFNHNYITINQRHQIYTRPELFYYSKNNFRFNFYMRYIFNSEGERTRLVYTHGSTSPMEELVEASYNQKFEVGMGATMNVNIPTGLDKHYTTKVVAFRDMNGNEKKDISEQGIGNMLITLVRKDSFDITNNSANSMANVYELVTNDDGFVEFQNVALGEYVVTARPLSSMGGWFDGKTFIRTIDKNKTIEIPLSKGARLSGGIIIERDKYSSMKDLNIANIRVTAVNLDNGNTHSTLTNSNGQFNLYIPNGKYQVSINEASVGGTFQFLQNNIPLKVTNDFDNYNISFYLTERKRKINFSSRSSKLPIRRASDNETDIKTDRDNSNEQRTQLEDDLYLPVIELNEDGEFWVVQLFENEEARKLKTDFDTLKNISNVKCIVGKGDGYLYISESFSKKRAAKKLQKDISKAGFTEAKVVKMVFGNEIEQKEIENIEQNNIDTNTKIDNNIDNKIQSDTTDKEADVKLQQLKDHEIINIDNEESRSKFRIEIKVSTKKLDPEFFNEMIPEGEKVYMVYQDDLFKYSIGEFDNYQDAKDFHNKLLTKYELKDTFVTQYKTSW